MYICDDGHTEICFDDMQKGKRIDCPLCAAAKEIEQHEIDNEELRTTIESLRDEIRDLRVSINE